MAARPNTPLRPIIVKKVIEEAHGGHHGGAWKVAYADFVTAMMAFFLLMWLLGATTEKQRKALADYFAPTIVKTKQESAGSNGMFGGDSIIAADNYPHRAGQTGTRSITIPRDVVGVPKEDASRIARNSSRSPSRCANGCRRRASSSASRATCASPKRRRGCGSTSSTTPTSRCS